MEQTCRFGSVVKKLMDDRGIKAAELARKLGMPYTTIVRIITGHTDNPMANTLVTLSEFFNVTVDYLLGKESIREFSFQMPEIKNSYEDSPKYICLWKWDFLKNWVYQEGEVDGHQEKVAVSHQLSSRAFALYTEKTYSDSRTIFPKESILIIDSFSHYKSKDYIVISINKNFPTIREVCEESGKHYLKAIGLNIPAIELKPEYMVFGKILECRVSL